MWFINKSEKAVKKIVDHMNEKRALPLGRQEFEDWSDRIISGALVTADIDSQKFALADMILHLNATESHKEDAYFIHYLRKTAANQVADTMRKEYRDKAKARIAAEQEELAIKLVDQNTPSNPTPDERKILENK